MSLSIYAMVAPARFDKIDRGSAEIFSRCTGIGHAVVGMSMLYGANWQPEYRRCSAEKLPVAAPIRCWNTGGVVFVAAGLAFKLGAAVPFHMWVPDVYEGSLTAVTLFIGSARRSLLHLPRHLHAGCGPGRAVVDWQQMLIILAVLSMGLAT